MTTSWFAEAAVGAPARRGPQAEPRPRPRAKPKPGARARARRRGRARGAVLWIAVSAALLAGVVFVNLAVLKLNLAVDNATAERAKLRAENASLQSQLSAALASSRIQAQARRRDGLERADSSMIQYVDLAP
ncbi:MAG TPA: hypothetical protein VFB42_08235 [Gaiellaceae bacterium]|nr:hypothetical protein [Gaiellaceae bacterium]